jgi:predicted ATPase
MGRGRVATAQTDQTASVIRTPDQRLRVFVSSTLEELSEERAAIRHAIEDLHLTPVMFELGASPHPPRALYRAYLEQSHVFVGVYWQRYGWVAPEMEVSGLEDEYLLSEGMPRLVYFKEPADEREEQMGEFVKRIKSGDNSFRKFQSTEELGELLREDLAHLLTERFESVATDGGRPAGSSAEADARAALPVPVTRLVGREDDTAKLLELVSWEDVRLVTLTGVGGIGKSRLALEVARRVQSGGMRVLFVDLTPVTEPSEVPRAIAAALTVADDGARPLIEKLAETLNRTGPALLVLDNFEQVVAAGHYVNDLLALCPDLRVLVASRILLDIRGEHHWEVAPLAHPTGSDSREVEVMADCPAVELFVERAQGADPRFVLSAENVDDVSELCGRLEGIPLALELAAAYVRFLPPAAMLERFDRRLDLEAHADHPDRQRTLRATIEWSYGLLDEAERELFARLAVFSGGWSLEAAQAICGEDCRADVLQTLSHLVDKSLVSIVDGGAEPRFKMLETVRVFAVERLAESGETATMYFRHAEYFAAFCEEVGAEIENHDIWHPRIDPDRENLLVIHERVAEDSRLLEPLIRAWAAVWVYAWARGLARQVLEIMETMEGAVSDVDTWSAELRSKFAFLMACGSFLTGDPEKSRGWSAQVLELTGETGDERLRALALLMLGASTPYETAKEEAEAALVESVELSRRLGFSIALDMGLAQLGIIRMRDGDLEEAIAMHLECVELGKRLRSRPMVAYAHAELAFDYVFKGELETARDHLIECSEYCRALEREGNREAPAYCLEGLAAVARAQGDPELAAKMGGASRAIRDVISTPVWALFTSLADQFVENLEEKLGPERLDELMAEGARMGTEDALSLGIAGTARAAT